MHVFFPMNIILAMMVLLITGCDNFTAPTAPTVPFSNAKFAVKSPHGATFHAIVVVDTGVSDIAASMRADLNNMNTLVDTIAANTGIALNKLVYSGSKATTANVRHVISTLAAGPDDMIMFYHSGHGGRTSGTNTPWPNMYFQNDPGLIGLNLYDVFALLSSKGSRLVLVMSDTCNSHIESFRQASFRRGAYVGGTRDGYQKLFLESRVAIIASSSVPGEFSYALPGGSLFTTQFLQALSHELSESNPSWSDVMESATRRFAGVRQHPQYVLY
jgi:hypothetical protein